MKILVTTNALSTIEAPIYSSHRAEMFQLGRYTKHEVEEWTAQRLSIDKMRNMAAQIALQTECDYLVFIDDDMILSPRTVETLVDSNYDIIMADTRIRSVPFKRMAFDLVQDNEDGFELDHVPDDVSERTNSEGIVDCYAIGFATVALKVNVLKKMKAPYFVTGPKSTEDIYYCVKAQQLIPDLKVGIHTKVPTQHKVDSIFVSTSNVEKLREMLQSERPTGATRGDRTEKYNEMIQNI